MFKNRKSAFTLVELMIVVVILGILAAIVVPQFTEAGTDAQDNALRSNLRVIRGQIELYKLQHGSTYPDDTKFSAQMTAKTDAAGAAGGNLGPYLQRVPNNPFTNNNVVGTGAVGTSDWKYDKTTGDFRANDTAAHAAY